MQDSLLSGAATAAVKARAASITGADNAEDEDLPKQTWQEILFGCGNWSLKFFFVGGFFGLLSLILYFIGYTGTDLVTSILLAITGLWATFEIRNIVAFRIQLQYLKKFEKKLEDTTKSLEGELNELSDSNDKLHGEIQEMEQSIQKIHQGNAEMKRTADEIQETVTDTKSKNEGLKNSISALDTSNEKLKTKCVELKETSDAMRVEIDALEQFKNNLKDHADTQSEDMQEIMSKVNDVCDKLERNVRDQEANLLGQIAQSIEFLDDDEGMDKKEFDLFVARMPTKFKNMLAAEGKSFEDFAGEDGEVDIEEVQGCIEYLQERIRIAEQ